MWFEYLTSGYDSDVYFDPTNLKIKKIYNKKITHQHIINYHTLHNILSRKKYEIVLPKSLVYNDVNYTKAIFSILDLGNTLIDFDEDGLVITYPPYVPWETQQEARRRLFPNERPKHDTPIDNAVDILCMNDDVLFGDISEVNVKIVPRLWTLDSLEFVMTDIARSICNFLEGYPREQNKKHLLDDFIRKNKYH